MTTPSLPGLVTRGEVSGQSSVGSRQAFCHSLVLDRYNEIVQTRDQDEACLAGAVMVRVGSKSISDHFWVFSMEFMMSISCFSPSGLEYEITTIKAYPFTMDA